MKRFPFFPLLALILLIASLIPVTPARAATTFTVNATDDTNDGVCNATHCSLREAINASEATPGIDTILFDLGPGIQTITLTSPLQSLEDVVIVDGADSDSERTEITGNGLNVSGGLFQVNSGGEFRNLVINHFTGSNLFYVNGDAVVIESSWLGLDADGVTALTMPQTLIQVAANAANFRLGGSSPAQGNRLSGVFSSGYGLGANTNSNNGIVQNNYFGLNVDGDAVTASGMYTAISLYQTSGWQIKNNVFGGMTNRTISLGNPYQAGSGGHTVQGNFIGTLADGNTCATVYAGILVGGSSYNLIGGSNPGEGNVIGCTNGTYNGMGNAIEITDLNSNGPFFVAGNIVRGNSIGVGANGTSPLPLSQSGVVVNTDAFPAELTTIENNTIANVGVETTFNGLYPGMDVLGKARIVNNRIFNAEKTAIDLNNSPQNAFGVTRNDALDADSGGGNDGQNYPHIEYVISTGPSSATVAGELHSEPNQTYRIELFQNDHLTSAFYGEAQEFVDAQDVTTDANGNATFSFSLSYVPAPGTYFAATATDPAGYTSELSLAFPAPEDWSVTSARLAFHSNRDGDYDIYTMKPDGSNVTNQTNTPSGQDELRPSWAWNGMRLLFDKLSTGGSGQNEWMLDLESGKTWMFATCSEIWGIDCYDDEYDAALSPNHRYLALVDKSYYGTDRSIYLLDFVTGAKTVLVSVPKSQDIGHIEWNSSSYKLLFHGNQDGDYEIYVYDIDAATLTKLTDNAFNDKDPVWRPDDYKVAFTTNRDGNFEVYLMGADGSNPQNLTNFPGGDDFQPEFSPEGDYLAFTSNRDGNAEIYLMEYDGSPQVRLTNDPGVDDDPSFSPGIVDVSFPTIVSILRADPNPTGAASVNFTVTFSEDVTGVDASDFSLTTTGSIAGASVTGVTGSGATYTVSVNTGSGSGTLRLDLNASGTGIEDLAGNPISGGYTSGEAYTLARGPIPDPWVGGVAIQSNQAIVTAGRPHVGSQVASYIGSGVGSTTQYVPMLFKDAFGGSYKSALYIQNLGNASASLTIEFINDSGVVHTITEPLAAKASKGYWLSSIAGIPAGFAGGAKITADQPILAVGRPHIGSEVMTYNGVSSGSITAWLPMFFKNGFGSYNTALYVQNITNASASLTIEYLNLDGTVACTDNDTLPANASKGYWSLLVACDSGSLPSGFVGGVKVTSSQNILAVGRAHLGSQITTYNGFAGGATNAYVPMLFKNAFGGSYQSALYLQNVSGSSANVTIEYVDNSGSVVTTQNVTLAANAISSIWLPSVVGLPDGFVGGARITADQNIIAVGRPHLGGEITAYNGASTGSLTAYLPMLFKNAFGVPYNAAFYIQNVTGSTANVSISFYDEAGTLSCIKNITLGPNATQGFWMPSTICAP